MILSKFIQGVCGRGLTSRPGNIINSTIIQQIRKSSGGHDKQIHLTASRFQWHKTKDMFHLYFFVGAIPMGLLVFYCNVFIGPAQLTPIPEGYIPKHWEYHRHPISRFISRYIWNSPQQEYEKLCHFMFEESEKIEMRKLEAKIKDLMSTRNDYQAYYYNPINAKYLRAYKKVTDDTFFRAGNFNHSQD